MHQKMKNNHLINVIIDQKKKQETIINDMAKWGRNWPCVCGSGKKYKKCCIKIFEGTNV